eukprot:65282-Chlamydomonas_euryale.AAC.3
MRSAGTTAPRVPSSCSSSAGRPMARLRIACSTWEWCGVCRAGKMVLFAMFVIWRQKMWKLLRLESERKE